MILRCRLSNGEVSFICIHSAAAAAAAALCVFITVGCFSFCYVDTVCGFITEYLYLRDYYYTLLHDVRVWICMYWYIPAMYFCCCCCCCSWVCCYNTAVAAAATACCCCSSSCAGWQSLLLWFVASDSSVFFLFIKIRFIFNVPLDSTIAFTASIFTYNAYHTSSVITGMRGAKAGVSPPRQSPPCIYMCRRDGKWGQYQDHNHSNIRTWTNHFKRFNAPPQSTHHGAAGVLHGVQCTPTIPHTPYISIKSAIFVGSDVRSLNTTMVEEPPASSSTPSLRTSVLPEYQTVGSCLLYTSPSPRD